MHLARAALALSIALIKPCALADSAQALFASKPCAACHSLDSPRVGPSLKQIAAKYAGTDKALEQVAANIQNGSVNRWGAIPMPPNAVSQEQALQLAEWILRLK